MPSIEENRRHGKLLYEWSSAGEKWSSSWGGPDMQWYGSLLPRIHAFLPTNTILEIL